MAGGRLRKGGNGEAPKLPDDRRGRSRAEVSNQQSVISYQMAGQRTAGGRTEAEKRGSGESGMALKTNQASLAASPWQATEDGELLNR